CRRHHHLRRSAIEWGYPLDRQGAVAEINTSLPARAIPKASSPSRAALIPSTPSPLLRGALAGAPQDEAKGSRGTRPPQDEEGFGRPHPEVRGRPSALPRPHPPEVRGRPSAPPPANSS